MSTLSLILCKYINNSLLVLEDSSRSFDCCFVYWLKHYVGLFFSSTYSSTYMYVWKKSYWKIHLHILCTQQLIVEVNKKARYTDSFESRMHARCNIWFVSNIKKMSAGNRFSITCIYSNNIDK
jgi:hypothetical protein